MDYAHTQKGRLHLVLYAAAALMLGFMWLPGTPAVAAVALAAAALAMVVCAMAFQTLTVEDEGQRLAIHFGPLALFRKRIPYDQITGVRPARSRFIDGWGIHYVPGRGWTYNVWGYDCVEIRLGKKLLRVGTDDVAGLTAFLQSKIHRPR
jgi:hypothetical protein